MRLNPFIIIVILLLPGFFLLKSSLPEIFFPEQTDSDSLTIEVKIGTFLGNDQRNCYGNRAPSSLNVLWKHYLGKGKTVISRKSGSRIWAGAGWTGQPLLVEENGRLYIIQGAYDHHLKKIDADSGKLVWQYKFDDVVKGTGTIWINPSARNTEEKYIILQGSRLGVGNYLDTKYIPSYRAISYITGKELWRMNVKWTDSYSRDVDGSALIIRDTAYIGLENSLFTVFDPDPQKANIRDGMLQPEIFQELKLYEKQDVTHHRYNVVTESSPSLLGNRIFIASGSGHVYGYNLKTKKLDWDFYIGSDIDGSAVVTIDRCLLISVEKQFIPGPGGAYKLDPSKNPGESVVWFYPTGNTHFGSWEGGIIGSIGITDSYQMEFYDPLAAFIGIDGYLYVVKHTIIDKKSKSPGPDAVKLYYKPLLVFKEYVGPSISTPVFVRNKLIVAGYHGVRLYKYDTDYKFELLDQFDARFESTPIAFDGKIYLASRDGYLYCFGD